MEDWKEYKLGDISDIQTGPFGSQLHQCDYVDVGTPCIMPTNIGTHLDIKPEGIAHVKEEDVIRLNKHCVKAGDIIYSRRGDIEKCAFISLREEGWLCGTGCLRIRINSKNVNPHFIAYQLSTKESKKWIVGNAVGTTMLNLNTGILKELPLLMPDRLLQDSVVTILKSLDDKIEVNKRINENLEQQAQALFKSWFVDFEPFKDQPFVESELGMIPQGWRVVSIGELPLIVTDYVANGSFASLKENVKLYQEEEYAYFIRNTDLKSGYFGVFVDKHSYDFLSKSRLFGGEIIISNVGDVGSVFLCPCLNKPMTLGNNIIMVKAEEDLLNTYLYILFRWSYGQGLIQSITGGSAQPKFNKTDFKSLKLVLPSESIISRHVSKLKSMIDVIESNKGENKRLAELRDTLLPRLMSGELKVNDVDA